jgi:AcrR family transcriptional regulator
MSPQPSNRQNLIDGALRCLERLPPQRVTARAIAEESRANLASIPYHFGSKDELVTEAVIVGLDRWLTEVERGLGELESLDPKVRFRRAGEVIDATRRKHTGLARNFLAALARAQFDPAINDLLSEGFRRTRPTLAGLLGLGEDRAGEDAAGLVHSMFVGLLFQELLDPSLGIEGARMRRAEARLRRILPESAQ